jgi:hypothetical protein
MGCWLHAKRIHIRVSSPQHSIRVIKKKRIPHSLQLRDLRRNSGMSDILHDISYGSQKCEIVTLKCGLSMTTLVLR